MAPVHVHAAPETPRRPFCAEQGAVQKLVL